MPKPPEKRPDRHYDFRRTNVVFAWTSLLLLVVTVWMVFADYAKPWKRLQSEFRDLERESVLAEMEAERGQLDATQIQEAQAAIGEAQEGLETRRAEIEELEADFVGLDKKVYAADAEARGLKSLLDTARYEYEQAALHGDSASEEAEATRLREEWIAARRATEELISQRDQVGDELAALRSDVEAAQDRLAELESDVATLEQRDESLAKGFDYFVLNSPVMDFVEPDLKVEQVMLPGLFHDINFTTVQRVDRCLTCHVASGREGFAGEEWEEPFRSHPRLDLFVSDSSPHPYGTFGCTTCHQGLDRATDFARAGHSPVDEEQLAAWKKDWGWKPQKYLDTPILPASFSEAGCVTCHAADVWTPGSAVQDVGRELITRMGCYGCHLIDYPAYQDLPRSGPSLNRISSKVDEGWAYSWIESPRDFRPTTWMPHFFGELNTELPGNVARQDAEIAAVVDYLWATSETLDYPAPPAGDAARGQQLFETVGCTGCHILDGEASRDDYFPTINRLNGPNLVRTGSKVDAGWLYAWIRDPKQYNPTTRMPDLRLTDGEAADIVAYLMDSRDADYEDLALPAGDPAVRDDLLASYYESNMGIDGARAHVAAMSEDERGQELGRETIQKYGCYACHDIRGFETAQPIGVELTEEGSKPVHQFDFGNTHDVPHTRHDWIETKLRNPRVWDDGKEHVKEYAELLKMPNFGMSEREAEAVMVNVLGFTKESVEASRRAGRSARTAALAEGRKLVTYYNCQGCHLVEGRGHAIETSIDDPGMLPPNLAAQGDRTQSDWLFEFLHDPGSVTLRPWLEARMPSFGFSDDQVNTLVSYFAAADDRETFASPPRPPADRRSLVVGEVAFNMLQCAKCHPAGPPEPGGVVSAGELAPSLLLATGRLRHDWVPDWILDPQSFIPGTNMPANFPPDGDGGFSSPMAQAIDAPMFASQKSRMMSVFESEGELKEFLADADLVAAALRDHIWWNLDSRSGGSRTAP